MATKIRVIPATAQITSAQEKGTNTKRRVAFYARVSTDNEEQLTSYDAQVDYYTKLIAARADWDFAGEYTDEGISGVTTKRREGFNQMVTDGLAGKFDLLVTKSVSRFARNTVDSLTTVRRLKDAGVEVWFEKENIYTLDSKGELLITIMSSLAQEESRSISENVTWGQRKRMADGKVTIPYRQFLGYEKGDDGLPRIVESEAATVRLIYRLFMEGQTFSAIAKHLTNSGILSPAGKPTWQTATVRSILTNEKYKGHALLQKTYCANFLTKKMVKNDGHIPQFYVEDSHEAIIEPHEFDAVQAEIQRRKNLGTIGRCSDPFSGKLTCGECGGLFGKKTWGSYSQDKTYRREIYRCNNKYENNQGSPCATPFVTEEQIKTQFLTAFNQLMANRDRLLMDCRAAKKAISDTSTLDAEIAKLHQEVAVVTELHRKAIEENARTAQDQDEFNLQNDAYLDRHRDATERIAELEAARLEKIVKAKTLDRFITDIAKRPLILTEFDAPVWLTTVDNVTVAADGGITFTFRNGTQIDV